MTRDEFITQYMSRSRLPDEWRTPDGFKTPNRPPQIALPCDCGEPGCQGWQMASGAQIADMVELSLTLPPDDIPAIPNLTWPPDADSQPIVFYVDEGIVGHAQVIDEAGKRHSVVLSVRTSEPERIFYRLNGKVYDYCQSPHQFVALTQYTYCYAMRP